MSAVLFGSISTVADTSELQRRAFNDAFAQHGLDWQWGQEEYRDLLKGNGGQTRIADYAQTRGDTVDAKAVHETKSALFQQSLATAGITARPGVVETVRAARSKGWKVGLVTTTSPANIASLLDALSPDLKAADFDVIVDSTRVEQPKPDKASYAFALETLGELADDCVAIEDNVGGVQAAKSAGLACVALPNVNTVQHDFDAADRRAESVDLEDLTELTQRA